MLGSKKGQLRPLTLNQALPFSARMALAHLTKSDDVLSGVDAHEGSAYAQRVGSSV